LGLLSLTGGDDAARILCVSETVKVETSASPVFARE
jgi:hypothetical protein